MNGFGNMHVPEMQDSIMFGHTKCWSLTRVYDNDESCRYCRMKGFGNMHMPEIQDSIMLVHRSGNSLFFNTRLSPSSLRGPFHTSKLNLSRQSL